MSINKIVEHAIAKNPLKLKEAFEEEISSRIQIALEAKMKKMKEMDDDEEEEDEEELDEAKKMKKEDDEDDDDEDDEDDDKKKKYNFEK
jgi:hypothetical protein